MKKYLIPKQDSLTADRVMQLSHERLQRSFKRAITGILCVTRKKGRDTN